MNDEERRELGRRAGDGDREAAARLLWFLDNGAEEREALKKQASGGCRVEDGVGCFHKGPAAQCDRCRARERLERIRREEARLCPACKSVLAPGVR